MKKRKRKLRLTALQRKHHRAALKGWRTRRANQRKREAARRRRAKRRRAPPKPVEYILRASYDSPRGTAWDAEMEIHIFAPRGATENQLISQLIEWSAGEKLAKGWHIHSIDWGKGELDSPGDIDIAREALGQMQVEIKQVK